MLNENIMLTGRPIEGEPVPRLIKIPNFDIYSINENAEIYNNKTNKKISTYVGIDNYEHCILFIRGKKYRHRVHRLMGKAFLGNPKIINHKDGNKSNNKLDNLERSTHSQNIKHAYDNGFYENTNCVKLIITNIETNEIIYAKSMREAERITNIDRHRIKTFIQNTRNNYTKYKFELDK